MKKIILKSVLLTFIFGSFSILNAQSWVRMMQDPNVNFYQTIDSFNAYWANKSIDKGKGYKVFKRWQMFMEPRVFPSGDVKLATLSYKNYETFQIENPDLFTDNRAPNNWTSLGPNGAPSNGGAGRLNFVRQDPTNANTIYVGAPDGGVWKTIDGGTSWTTTTDQVTTTSIGFGDIAIDPSNTQVLYASTGDAHAQDSYSVGLLKSTNGGSTWATTGLTFTVDQGAIIKRVLLNPTNTQIIIVASNAGILRSTDGGANWATVRTGSFGDMEFKPGDPTVVYAAGSPTGGSEQIWKSTNSGLNWTQVTSGLPASNVQRLSIAVSANNAAYVYVLAGNSADQGLLGVYRSTDSGTTFTTRTGATPNYLGYEADGSDAGGQAFYDLTIACSPTNAQDIYIGGINIWRSINGGTNWTFNAHWTGQSAPYVHSDVHDIMFGTGSGTTLFAATDGGLFKTTNNGTAWTDISSNLAIAQQYSISSAQTNVNKILTGHQDNGANLYSSGTWNQVQGGDGMDVVIDRTNASVMYEGYVYGEFRRSTDGGNNWTLIFTGPSGSGGFFAPFKQDPSMANTVYGGYQQLYKSTDRGTTSSAISAFAGTTQISEFAIAPSNSQIIYVIRGNTLFKTINGGTNWTNATGTIPSTTAQMTYISISPTDANKVWVTLSGYTAANKVFKTTNGGTSWSNISSGLPNLPVNCAVYQAGSATDAIYVGCDVGVYYTDNSISGWQPFFTGLPNVVVRELDIYNTTGKMRAATYGRGSWSSDVNTGANAPIAAFTSNTIIGCAGNPIQFTDASGFTPTSWAWLFPSGSPATSTAQNPSATWSTPGTYTVQLTATNANGSNVTTQVITIIANTATTVTAGTPFVEGFISATFPPANWAITEVGAVGTWARNTTTGIAPTAGNSAWFNNYNIDNTGSREYLTMPKLNVSGSTAVTLTFDVAYARYNAVNVDTLLIEVSNDCGITWTNVYNKNGTVLATNGGADVGANGFIPTAGQWRNETVNLNAYNASNSLAIRFVNGAKYGQALYIDNVNLSITAGATAPVVTFAAVVARCAGASFTPTNTYTNSPTSYAWTSSPAGVSFSSTTVANPVITFPGGANTYTLNVVASNGIGSSPMTSQTIVINAIPSTPAATVVTPICIGSTITLSTPTLAGATYAWSGPNSYTSSTQNPTITGATAVMAGVYNVTRTISSCTSAAGSTFALVINPLPATPTATVSTPICAGSTITLTTPTLAGATYSWSGPNSYTSAIQNPTITGATAAMAGVYTVTRTVSGCTSLAGSTSSLVVNAIPATPTPTVSTPVCIGATISFTTPTAVGANYTWSGPAGFNSAMQNPTRTGATAAMAGVYTITQTLGGCTSIAGSTAALVVNPIPATPTATATSPICVGEIISLATPSLSGATYSWTGPNSFTSSVQNPTISGATAAMSGVYSVTRTVGGCASLAGNTASVVINALPATPIPTNSGPYCTTNTIALSASTVVGATYAWTGPNSFTSSVQNPTISGATVAMSGNYNLIVTIAGCSSLAGSTQVNINSTSVPPTITTNSPICIGTTLNLGTVAVPGAIYSWTGPNAFSSASQNPVLTAATNTMAGNYILSITVAGCTSAIGNSTVVVNANPATPIANSVNSALCAGATISLSTATLSGATYAWTGPNAFTSSSQNPNITSSSPAMSGSYNLIVSAGGCSSSAGSTSVTVNPLPLVNAGPDVSNCNGLPITLTATGAANFVWNNGVTNGVSFVPTVSSYTVIGTDANGCFAQDNVTVNIGTSPTISLGADIIQSATGATLNAGAGFTSYLWNTAATSPTIVATSSGTYFCTVTNAAGCSATDTIQVTYTSSLYSNEAAANGIQIYPNPNDGIFSVIAEQKNIVSVQVLDVLGRLIFTASNEPNSVSVDISKEAMGSYKLVIETKTAKFETKILKTK